MLSEEGKRWRKTLVGKFLDWLDRQTLAVAFLFLIFIPLSLGLIAGSATCKDDAKRMIEEHDKEAFEVYAKQQKMIEELTVQRDECRLLVNSMAQGAKQ